MIIPRECICGTIIHNRTNKFCSPECRAKYQVRRRADPTKQITFNCQSCEVEVTRYKKYGNGAMMFCSNECAAKHTKVKKHYIVRDMDMVLDSGWEALFVGLCKFLKIPVERIDRFSAVEWQPENWYAPDFWMPSLDLAVEIKGLEDDDDPEKWIKWRRHRGPLVIVDQTILDDLRQAQTALEVRGILFRVAAVTVES